VHVLPSVQVTPFTAVLTLAKAEFGIALAATARDGAVVELVTVGTNHVGHDPEGAAKLVKADFHVPSPNQAVVLDAPVPLFKLLTGRFPKRDVAWIVPDPVVLSDAPVPITIVATVFVPEMRHAKVTHPLLPEPGPWST
jgi:hypothetical protein